MAANPLTGPVLDALGLGGFHPSTGAGADDLGDLLFGDYEGDLNEAHDGPRFDHEPPRDLEDLVEDLRTTAARDVPDGVISIQQITDPEGHVDYVVDLPGTDEFLSEGAIRNLGSNLNLIAGDSTAYGDAIAQAMADAQVPADAPVMLVGHSQGGMQAAALAGDPDFDYHVTHVLTAGSPVATSGIPDDMSVLSLEYTADLVPLLDGEDNPDGAHTDGPAHVSSGSFGAEASPNDPLSTYEQIAAAADGSANPRCRTPSPACTSRTSSPTRASRAVADVPYQTHRATRSGPRRFVTRSPCSATSCHDALLRRRWVCRQPPECGLPAPHEFLGSRQ